MTEFPELNESISALGDFSGDGTGFVGFVYKAEFFNFLNKPGEVPLLEDCEVEHYALEECYNSECLDRMCEISRKRYLISCFDPA